jgi:hypothetical protein
VRLLRRRAFLNQAAAWLAPACLSVAAASPGTGTADGHVLFHMHDPRITESSSLVVSTVQPHVVYTANDSGDGAYIYSVNMRTGRTTGVATLAGVRPQDVEAMAPGPDDSLYFADIGDNESRRMNVTVYWFTQPGPGDTTITDWHSARLKYPRGARDAETLLVDPSTGRLFVVSKQIFAGTVYRAPQGLSEDHVNHLHAVGVAPSVVTDGAFLSDGMVVLRTYGQAELVDPDGWRASTATKLPPQPQGESIAAIPGSDDVLIGTEGSDSAVQPQGPTLRPRTAHPPQWRRRQQTQTGDFSADHCSLVRRSRWRCSGLVRSCLRSLAGAAGVEPVVKGRRPDTRCKRSAHRRRRGRQPGTSRREAGCARACGRARHPRSRWRAASAPPSRHPPNRRS